MNDIQLKVNGMQCEGCEKRIINALLAIDGIDKVIADHKQGIVKIETNKDIESNIIKRKIEDIGFEIKED